MLILDGFANRTGGDRISLPKGLRAGVPDTDKALIDLSALAFRWRSADFISGMLDPRWMRER